MQLASTSSLFFSAAPKTRKKSNVLNILPERNISWGLFFQILTTLTQNHSESIWNCFPNLQRSPVPEKITGRVLHFGSTVFLNGSNCECTLEQLPNYKSSGSWLQSKRGILHIFVQLNDVENCARKGKEKKVNGCANLF